MNKNEIRREKLARRKSLSPIEKSKKDGAIIARLVRLPIFKKTRHIFIYLSHLGEVSTEKLLEKWSRKKTFYAPRVKGRGMELCAIHDTHEYRAGRFGILEPPEKHPASFHRELDLVLVPAVAFDLRGHRIGYGGGYYDRFLKKVACTTIGLAYEFQIVDNVPEGPYDIAVDYIITEKRLIACHRSKSTIRSSTPSSPKK